MSAPRAVLRAVLRGTVQPLGRSSSAIDKRPVDGPVAVHALGLAGDEQADRRVHGGPDKALHAYAWAHHADWRAELPGNAWWGVPGAFGENLCVDGLDEHGVCIGDRWRVGSTTLVVTQGRQPCFKLNLRFGQADMAARVQATGRRWGADFPTVTIGDMVAAQRRNQLRGCSFRHLAAVIDNPHAIA